MPIWGIRWPFFGPAQKPTIQPPSISAASAECSRRRVFIILMKHEHEFVEGW